MSVEEPAILCLVSGGKALVLDETNGIETIPASKGVFAYVSPNFKAWGADEASGPTPKTPIEVHALAQSAAFAQMFGSNPGALCLTQSQILGFVKKYRNWLWENVHMTFFLFRSRGEFFVADVFADDRGRFWAGVDRFERAYAWGGVIRLRIVLP